jgi:hypothetical protein
VPIVLKSGSILEPSGPVQAFIGIALPFYIALRMLKKFPQNMTSIQITEQPTVNLKININN